MPSREREKQIKIYLTEDEVEILEKNMKKSGLNNRSVYIRKMCLDGIIVNVDLKILKELSYEINKVGVNINQIAKQVNEMQNISKQEIEDLKSMLKSINLLQRDTMNLILSQLK